jgi:site-specific DNA-cytosine methylase
MGNHSGMTILRTPQGDRRLTVTEWERLQGFPDGWTSHGQTKDGLVILVPDGNRYKVLGDAVTVPAFVAVFDRLLEVWAEQESL